MGIRRIFFLIVLLQCIYLYSNEAEFMNDVFLQGIDFYKEKNYLSAIEKLSNINSDSDEYTNSLYWIAKSYYELDLFKKSQEFLEELIRLGDYESTYIIDARFLYCKIFFKEGYYDDTLFLLKQFLRNYPDSVYTDIANVWLGETYLQLSELDLSYETFNKYLKKYPDDKLVLKRVEDILLAKKLISQGGSNSSVTMKERMNWFEAYLNSRKTSTLYSGIIWEILNAKNDSEFNLILDNIFSLTSSVNSPSLTSSASDSEDKTNLNTLTNKSGDEVISSNDKTDLLDLLESKLLLELGDGR